MLSFFPQKYQQQQPHFGGRTHHSISFDRYYCVHAHTQAHTHWPYLHYFRSLFSRLIFDTGIIIHLLLSILYGCPGQIGVLHSCSWFIVNVHTFVYYWWLLMKKRKKQAVIVCFSSIRKINDTKCFVSALAPQCVCVCVCFSSLCIF